MMAVNLFAFVLSDIAELLFFTYDFSNRFCSLTLMFHGILNKIFRVDFEKLHVL